MKIKLHLDDIIYVLQEKGGISTFWKELTSRISDNNNIQIQRTKGNRISRYLPVHTKSDLFHSSFYRKPLGKSVKTVVTIHDFIYELGYLKTLNARVNILQVKLALDSADAIVCVSENTKKDLLLIYPSLKSNPNIYVVNNGVSLKYDETLNSQYFDRFLSLNLNKPQKYILFVGKRVKYKNFESALLGFYESRLTKQGFSMICVGSDFSNDEYQCLNKLGLQKSVLAIDNVTNRELNYLYQNSYALVYPSLYEGFGLPPLEAMNCGCPVIASNTSSIPEVVGDAGILINPQDVKAIASALEILLCEETRNNYIKKGFERAKLFAWDKAAEKYIEIYRSLVLSKSI
jgi:glycosyltransferase involved in cell wall biosynthesis